MILNPSQRKELAAVMQASGYSPAAFQMRTDASCRAAPNFGEEYQFIGTGFYFRIFLREALESHSDQFWVEYSPGEKQLREYDSCWDWSSVTAAFKNYLRRLKLELGANDPWTQPGIARVVKNEGREHLIPAGNQFTGQRLVRQVFAGATKRLDIIDPYIGPELLERIDDARITVPLRLLGSKKTKVSLSLFISFKANYPHAELRILQTDELHDRFIIVDGTKAFKTGHSIKDLGKKDTHVSEIEDVGPVVELFEQRWGKAKPLA